MSDDFNAWKVISTIGKGIAKGVQLIGEGTNAAVKGVNDGTGAVRDSMPVTEITSIFNTTDRTIKFVNREQPRDNREILGQTQVGMKTDRTAGSWVPWYEPPRFGDFANRHIEIQVDGMPVIYVWQRGNYIYWTNRLDSEGRPAKAYKIAGVDHVGGTRTLVVRNDPDNGFSAFLSNTIDDRK
jgi:hypothetical protein